MVYVLCAFCPGSFSCQTPAWTMLLKWSLKCDEELQRLLTCRKQQSCCRCSVLLLYTDEVSKTGQTNLKPLFPQTVFNVVHVHVFTLLLLRQSREWMIKKKWESRSVSSKLCRLTLVFSQNCGGVRKDFLLLYPIKQLVLFRFCVGVYCKSVQKVSAAGKLLRCCDMKCLHEKEMLQHVPWKRWGDDLTRLVVLIYSFAVEFLSLSLRLLTGWFWYLTALCLF